MDGLAKFNDARDWFFENRFGLFVHWGLYAIKGWHEQEIWRWPVSREDYAEYASQFNPVRFDANAWLDAAAAAGMDYVVFTTKHIDGFCNWDSAHTDFKITNTSFGRDVLKELSDACQHRGVPLCLYYSIPDMHHPNYPHAGRPYEYANPLEGDEPNVHQYLAYVEAQARELLTNYGPIHGWWWDANVIEHVDESFHDMIHELQPQAVINNRGFGRGDFKTPERDWDNSVNAMVKFEKPTEANTSIGLISWSYKPDEDYYSDWHLQHSVAKILAKGGNYLLNVGPQPDGAFSGYSQALLSRMGSWFKRVREAFCNVEGCSDLTSNDKILLTRKGDTLYAVLHKPPVTTSVRLKPIDTEPRSVTLLNTGQPIEYVINRIPGYGPGVEAKPFLRLLNVPVNELAGQVLVLKIEFAPGEVAQFSGGHQGQGTEREFSADAYE
ncbi:MAG: alpha-L-fucosidase [Planctomycetota bacterium]